VAVGVAVVAVVAASCSPAVSTTQSAAPVGSRTVASPSVTVAGAPVTTTQVPTTQVPTTPVPATDPTTVTTEATTSTTTVLDRLGPVSRALGVVPGGLNVTGVQAIESWLGRPVTSVVEYVPTNSWSAIADNVAQELNGTADGRPGWGQYLSRPGFTFVLSLPLAVGTFDLQRSAGRKAAVAAQAEIASGRRDDAFRSIARQLVAHGAGNSIIRLGWESSGDWFAWRADLSPATWVAAYRRVVDVMRSVDGQGFRFEWGLAQGSATGADPSTWYPGDDVVDVVSVDLYDASGLHAGDQVPAKTQVRRTWADPVGVFEDILATPFGPRWTLAFAKAHGKSFSLGEWALSGGGTVAPTAAGNDDPHFVQAVYDWLASADLPIAYEAYFLVDHVSDGPHNIQDFPTSADVFLKLFGVGAG